MTKEIKKSLAGIKLLSGLSAAEIEALERASRWRRHRAKKQIFDRDSDGTDLFFVVVGKIQILNYSPSGREIAFAELAAGDYFGELAALDGGRRSASAVAIEDTTLASISSQAFKSFLMEHPKVSLDVLLNLTDMVRNADERIMDLSTLSAINRVHIELLRIASSTDTDGNSAIIRPIPTHSEIASRAGTTRETVSRVFSRLARVCVIERMSDALKVVDLRRLNDMIEPAIE